MAQAGFTPLRLYYSATTTNAPTTGNLVAGELAINTTDGKLFYKDSSNVIQVIGWKTTPVSAGGTGLTSGTSGGIPYYSSSSAITSSAVLAASALVIGGGAGAAPSTTTTGAGVVTALGSAANATGGFTTINGTATLTNKRITTRVLVTASSATAVTPDISSYDEYAWTAQAATLTINAPTGTPVDGDKLLFRILDNGTARTLTWNATFTAVGATLPTTTTAGKTTYVGCIYNANSTRWDVVAVATQA